MAVKEISTMQKQWIASFKANLPWIIGVMVLGILPFLGFLFSGKNLYASDQIASPGWKFFFDSLRSGELTLWSPWTLGGTPTYDAVAGDASYPLFLLLGLLLPVEKVVGINFVLHCLMGGAFAFILLRGHFRLDRFISASLAMAYMLNTNYLSLIYSGHTGKFHVLSWLPLGLYFLLETMEKGATWRKLLGLSLTVTMMVLTGHLQFTYYVLMGYFLYYAFLTAASIRGKDYRETTSLAVRFWGPILLGVGLCFPLLWAPLQYNKSFSVRGEASHQTFEHATSWSMHPEEAISLVVPEFTGLNEHYWGRNPFKLNSEYPGIAVWVLGLFGLIAFRRGFSMVWAGVGILAIIFGLGAHTPLFQIFYAVIPGIKSFRAPSMMLFWLATSLLLMSAHAMRLLTTDPKITSADRQRWSKRLLQFGGGIAAILILAGLSGGTAYEIWNAFISADQVTNLANQKSAVGAFDFGAIRCGVLILALVFAVRKWILQDLNERAFAMALAVIVAADLYSVGSHFIETYDFDRMFPREAAIEKIKTDPSAFRIFGMPGTFPKGYTQYHKLGSVEDWVDQEFRLYRAFRGNDYSRNPFFMENLKQNQDGSVEGNHFLDMLNVKYLCYRLPDYPGVQVSENRSALPRAWFVTQWESVSVESQIDRMRAPEFDPHRLALLDPASALPSGGMADSLLPNPKIEREMFKNNSLRYHVQNDKEGILLVSEVWFPFWRLRVDGKSQSLLRANYLFRGVHLLPGDHRIEMQYVSDTLLEALWGSFLAGLGLIALCFGWSRFGGKIKTAPTTKTT